MTGVRNKSNKAKIARRVVEVLEYFDEDHPEATVMDIVRRYDRPQSSTSELLSSLVELGLLHKDPYARSYRPTVRAALLGATTQHGPVRDGRLLRLLDRVVSQTGLPVLLIGRIGLEAQIVSARAGNNARHRTAAAYHAGMREPLTCSAAGQLLLSTLEETRREPAIRRLNAEADDSAKFNPAQMSAIVADCARTGSACGAAGFSEGATAVARLLPSCSEDEALAVVIVMDKPGQQEALMQCLEDAVASAFSRQPAENVESLATAA